MISQPIKISLADRDLYIMQINSQIEAKKKFLIERDDILKEESKNNEYLDLVRKEYQELYHCKIKQKREEIQFINKLNNYLEDILKKANFSKEEIEKHNKDQKKILDEIKEINKELDKLIKKTKKYTDNNENENVKISEDKNNTIEENIYNQDNKNIEEK